MRKLFVVLTVLLVTLVFAWPAAAHSYRHHRHHWSRSRYVSGLAGDTAVPTPAAVSPGRMTIQLTGYGAADNTPAGSKTISMPTIHAEAGGNCTYSDPVTFASPGQAGATEFPQGVKVYFPKLRCYGISEDSGATRESVPHIDIYTGDGPRSVTDRCEEGLTGATSVVVSPPRGEPVNPGPLSGPDGCSYSVLAGYQEGTDASSPGE